MLNRNLLLLFTIFLSAFTAARAQQFFVSGSVRDESDKNPLIYANVRVLNSTTGSTANKSGDYEIKLPPGKYRLVASYIGYLSDTLEVDLKKNLSGINFNLKQSNINLPEIVVHPGENPAIRIVKGAMARKDRRNKLLNSYEFDAYTKGIIKTQKDIQTGSSSVSLNTAKDTAALKITGIIENESKGYFKKPDLYKEVITARKQTSNFESSLNILTGGRMVKSFLQDYINFFGRDIPGPLAPNAIDYYDFNIKDVTSINKLPVYDISMTPANPNDPGFVGNIFIADSSFDLIKIDLRLNRAANVGGILDSIDIFQQFALYPDSIYMPVDYRLFVTANILGMIKLGFEINTILFDYKINPPIDDDFFNKAVVTVLPNADNKDSTYWQEAVTIPNTIDEKQAYKRIDSISAIPKTFWDRFSFLSSKIELTKNFSISAPLGMYHFNRVEGNALDFGLFLSNTADKRLNSSLQTDYGFSDKKFKTNFNASYLLGDYRTYKLSLNAFNKLNVFFESPEGYNDFFTSLLALISKDDFRNYYYSNGFGFTASGDVFPVLRLSAGFSNRTDKSAVKNSDFSFFAKDKSYNQNPPIYDTKINSVSAGFGLDFRDYIEDGFSRRRINSGNSFITFYGNINFSDKSFLKSDLYFTTYVLKSEGVINTFRSQQLEFKIRGMYTDGKLPYQLLYAVPGNIDLTSNNFSFRTLNLNEVLGDRVVTVYLEHNFGDEIFRFLKIPYVQNWEILITGFVNAAYSDIGKSSRSILPLNAAGQPNQIRTFRSPFFEAGFEIGQVLFPFQLDFAWKLNYRGKNNFRIGINALLLW